MQFIDIVEKIEESKQFQDWKKEHPNWFLAHGFLQPEESPDWQLGYSDGEKVVTILASPLSIMPEQEVYKKPEKKILELEKDSIVLEFEDAMEIFNSVHKEKYSQEQLFKHIVLIQNIEGTPLYNITGISRSFKTLNIRMGMDGRVLNESFDSLMQQWQKLLQLAKEM